MCYETGKRQQTGILGALDDLAFPKVLFKGSSITICCAFCSSLQASVDLVPNVLNTDFDRSRDILQLAGS